MAISATGSSEPKSAALTGLRVALARAAEEFNSPAPHLRTFGAELVYYPCLELLPPDNLVELDRCLQECAAGSFDWLVFTTASSVIAVAERLDAISLAQPHLKCAKIAAYGSNTRAAVHDLLHFDEILPETYSHHELVRAMNLAPGTRVLVPLPAGSRADWPAIMGEYQAQVIAVTAYRAVMGQGGHELPAMLWSGDVDGIVFTSEDNVRYFSKRLKYEGGSLSMLDDVTVACIDPQTAAVARGLGLNVGVVPLVHSPRALAEALANSLVGG